MNLVVPALSGFAQRIKCEMRKCESANWTMYKMRIWKCGFYGAKRCIKCETEKCEKITQAWLFVCIQRQLFWQIISLGLPHLSYCSTVVSCFSIIICIILVGLLVSLIVHIRKRLIFSRLIICHTVQILWRFFVRLILSLFFQQFCKAFNCETYPRTRFALCAY